MSEEGVFVERITSCWTLYQCHVKPLMITLTVTPSDLARAEISLEISQYFPSTKVSLRGDPWSVTSPHPVFLRQENKSTEKGASWEGWVYEKIQIYEQLSLTLKWMTKQPHHQINLLATDFSAYLDNTTVLDPGVLGANQMQLNKQWVLQFI